MTRSAPTGSLTGAFVALVRRDLLLAFRRRTELLFPVIFLLVVISLFPLGIGPGPQLLARIAPGVIWIAALLATVISLDGLFRSDFEDGTLEQLFLSAHPLSVLVLAKVSAHWLVTGLPLIVISPVLAVTPSRSRREMVISWPRPWRTPSSAPTNKSELYATRHAFRAPSFFAIRHPA